MRLSSGCLKLLLLALWLLPAAAQAGGQALIEVTAVPKGAPLRLEFDDTAQVRMELTGQAGGYWLLRADGLYHVGPAGADPIERAGSVNPPLPDVAFKDVAQFIALDELTGEVPVAGIHGRRHLLSYQDADGNPRRAQLILSSDLRARQLTQVLRRVQHAFAPQQELPAGAQQLLAELNHRRLGVLFMQNRFILRAFDEQPPALARLKLPEAWQRMAAGQGLINRLGTTPALDERLLRESKLP